MALDTSKNGNYEGLNAAVVLATAFFEQSGLTEQLDSVFDPDARRKLTPGNAVKALIGDMVGSKGRSALFNVCDRYRTAPVDLMFGSKVDIPAMGGTAFARILDLLFEKDLPALTYDCYRGLADRYGLSSDMFNIDSTNFGITATEKETDRPDAAVPERCGHAKDKHNENLVYTLLSVTDENGAVCYERPYDGATADSVIDEDAIRFLSSKVDPHKTTLIADCKIATNPLVNLMESKGFGFVTKCPNNFGKKARSRIVKEVIGSEMVPSSIRKDWEIYDTDEEIDGRVLRFVAFRTSDDIEEGMNYLRKQGLKEAEARFRRFGSKTYNCIVDAERAIADAVSNHTDSAYDVDWTVVEKVVNVGYGRRGRPSKDSVPETKTEYAVSVSLNFNEEKAKTMSRERGLRVLVTNLPRTEKDMDNIRFGATADTVLKAYLDQYKVEHAFRLAKDGMKMSRVYIHKPSRENAMMFVISLGTMISDVIAHVLKSKGINNTTDKLAGKWASLILRYDRERDAEYFQGPDDLAEEFLNVFNALELDVNRLIH